MGFLSKLFGVDPWARLPQSFQIAVRRKLSTDEFDQLTMLLRKYGQLREAFPGVEDPQFSNEDIPAFVAVQLAIFAASVTFTEPERELLVDLSLKLEPEENPVWKQKAYMLVSQSRFSEAQDAARQALKILKTDGPDTPEADQDVREIGGAMGLSELFDQNAAIDQTKAALKGIVQGRYNLLYFKSRVDSMTYEVMKQVVVGMLQQKGVKLSSEADLEQKGLDPDFQRVLAATAVHGARLSLSNDDQVTAALAYQAANRFDEFNFDAHHALAIFMNHAVQNADEADPEVHVREATRQAWLHAGMALKLLQVPQVRHEIDQAEQKEVALEQILRAHPQP
jgi:tetratricopeptide (TPR) repeat protein